MTTRLCRKSKEITQGATSLLCRETHLILNGELIFIKLVKSVNSLKKIFGKILQSQLQVQFHRNSFLDFPYSPFG